MKLTLFLFLFGLIVVSSCTTYHDFNKENSFVFHINDSSQVVLGAENRKGPEDCSAVAYLNRLETGLLLTIRVTDDSVRTGNESSYMNDGVEIYMDLRPPRLRKRNIYEKGVFQAVVIPLPGKKNVAPIEWFPKNYHSELTGARAITQLNDSGYVVQVFFPYSNLRRNHYWPRNSFGIDIAINDADSLNRETQMMWRGKADNWSSPANFETITLPKEDKPNRRANPELSGKPNVLLILTSQQTINAMSAYGNPYLKTPNMDALAQAGIRFTQSYCSSPAIGPALSSILTGKYPHLTGVNYTGDKPDSLWMNLGHIMRAGGYESIWGGKWDLPEAFPNTSVQDSSTGFRMINFINPERATGRAIDSDSPLTEAMTKQLQRRPTEPWLMVVSYLNPHDIALLPAKPDIYLPAVNPESAPPLPQNFNSNENEPLFLLDCRREITYDNTLSIVQKYNPAQWRNYIFQYYKLVEKVDAEIGKILTMLETTGYDQNTLIILTSDQGDGNASHRWAGGLSAYQEAVQVPLIISWFGKDFKKQVDSYHLVSGMDILPTILDYAGITEPQGVNGRSLKPIIEKPDTSFREFLITEIASDPSKPERMGRMIRYRSFKYVLYSYGISNEQLFDLQNDPGETVNLAGNPNFSEIKELLRSNLESRMAKTKDYFPIEK
ncbi:MAG: sulfatase-like hydrolase/transferase [Bacteroidales bacterium]|nr:sulfatase-like hydrolase/transferase [Bacteroidales bacterium]